MDAKDYTIIHYIERLVAPRRARLRDVRLAGVAYILTGLMCIGFEVNALDRGGFYPMLFGVVGYTFTAGPWFLLDATALTEGRRRHQRALYITCGIVGVAGGIVAMNRWGG